MNKKLVLCISAIILIILGIAWINNINKKENGVTANNAEKFQNIEYVENMEEIE